VKYLILSVLQDGPKHGYEIMRSLEEKSQGAYAPSAGTIYPTLQMLEDMTYLQGRETDGRRVFALGRFAEPMGPAGDERRLLREEVSALGQALFADERLFRASPETLGKVRAILRSARQQIHSTLSGDL
jgi:DNA-binding PadR family transcriptional regulator